MENYIASYNITHDLNIVIDFKNNNKLIYSFLTNYDDFYKSFVLNYDKKNKQQIFVFSDQTKQIKKKDDILSFEILVSTIGNVKCVFYIKINNQFEKMIDDIKLKKLI